MVRGIRGAICVADNTRRSILEAASELLREMIARNQIESDNIISIFMTTTPDLNAEFPAYAVRENGLTRVPVLCASEIDVPTGMKSLIRILLHLNTNMSQEDIKHVYLGEAAELRPDLAGEV
jgi:chorismate mutase